ncbi:arylsulfatase [Croceicoccus sp. BE223]|uniref:arylsulfatase n=1 Tax=Croceicoccus sp. BE223 TaxID=2817716 RepID=UPI0028653913|nr:arylsulfatase [Croceicoccus sp. BE223]MDR7103729.1 arylsulfatase [Croceicoccus sp. BE223]
MLKRTLLAGCASLLIAQTAVAQTPDRTILPIRAGDYKGTIAERVENSVPDEPFRVTAPAGAPNVIVVMTDDVGFATASAFGGPVATPVLDRLAKDGVRYNRFHTTGICSPSRAALLTGRNHHATGNGYLSDLVTGFPGYRGEISNDTATMARVLSMNGFSTAMFGKHHNTLKEDATAAGPFDHWPTGLGFQYFYGWVGGDTDQYTPTLYRGTDQLEMTAGDTDPTDKRLADDAIRWIHNQKAAAADKPFFMYYAPGTLHAPHQAPRAWIDRYKGQFNQGWDKMREETLRRQLAQGVVPKGTKLTPRPAEIPAWDSLDPRQKEYASRMMEVAAGALAYQDAQFGRIIDELDRMGQLDNTLIIFVEGDNGASGEGGPEGTLSEIGSLANRIEEGAEWLHSQIPEMGGPKTYENYPVGWAWAMVTPLRWVKQNASYLGGVRNGMVMSWRGREANEGSICNRFGHLVDIAPTVYEAVGIPAPTQVNGFDQKPINGQSLLSTLKTCNGNAPRTQYFEMGGKLGIYQDGWFANRDDGRVPWADVPPEGYEGKWELYNLDKDFGQATNLAEKYPAKLEELKATFHREALANNVYPLDSRFSGARRPWSKRGSMKSQRYDFWAADTYIAYNGSPNYAGRSFTVDADVVLDSGQTSGVIVADGSHFAGWSFLMDDGVPTVVHAFSTKPSDITRIAATQAVPAGKAKIVFGFKSDGGVRSGGTVTITANGKVIGSGRIDKTIVRTAGLGENFDVGRDTGVPVTDYDSFQGRFTGKIDHVALTID